MEYLLLQSHWRTFTLFLHNLLIKAGTANHLLALQFTWADTVKSVTFPWRLCWCLCFSQQFHSPRGQDPHLLLFISLAHCRSSGCLLIAYVMFALYEDQGFRAELLSFVPFQLPGSSFFKCAPTHHYLLVLLCSLGSSSWSPFSFSTLRSLVSPLWQWSSHAPFRSPHL